MAKRRKKRSRRQGFVSKAINAALIGLTFARPISIMLGAGNTQQKVAKILREATFGIVQEGGGIGQFNLNEGLAMYAPAGAAFALGKIKGFAMRHFPVRG